MAGARHIGIVGCSAEGASLCYRTICAEGAALLGAHAHPDVSLHTPSFSRYVACLEAGDLAGVAALMLDSARRLQRAGADFLICPDNTIHQAFALVEAGSPLPWLHIAEVVAEDAVARGFKRVGLLGTHWLVESEVYPQKMRARGVDVVRPPPDERRQLSRIIMDELVCGVFRTDSIERFQRAIDGLAAAGCDAVVLGCTEIPLIIGPENSSLPTLDSTRLLARAALLRACSGVRPE